MYTIKVEYSGGVMYFKTDDVYDALLLVGMLTRYMGDTGTAEILKDN